MSKTAWILTIIVSICGLANAGVGDTNSDLCFNVKDSKKFLNVNPMIVPQPTPPIDDKVKQVEQSVLKFYETNCGKISKTYTLEKFFNDAYLNCYDKCKSIVGVGSKQVSGDFCPHQCAAYNWQASALIDGKKDCEKTCGEEQKKNSKSSSGSSSGNSGTR